VEVWNNKWGPLRDKIICEVGIFPTEGQLKYVETLERGLLERKTNLRIAVAQIELDFLNVPGD